MGASAPLSVDTGYVNSRGKCIVKGIGTRKGSMKVYELLIEPLAPWKNWVDGGAALFALGAAVLWFLASVTKVPRELTRGFELPATGVQHGDIAAILIALGHQSRLNAWAAGCAGVSALLVGLGVMIGTRWG